MPTAFVRAGRGALAAGAAFKCMRERGLGFGRQQEEEWPSTSTTHPQHPHPHPSPEPCFSSDHLPWITCGISREDRVFAVSTTASRCKLLSHWKKLHHAGVGVRSCVRCPAATADAAAGGARVAAGRVCDAAAPVQRHHAATAASPTAPARAARTRQQHALGLHGDTATALVARQPAGGRRQQRPPTAAGGTWRKPPAAVGIWQQCTAAACGRQQLHAGQGQAPGGVRSALGCVVARC
jgi:hypothetical protein